MMSRVGLKEDYRIILLDISDMIAAKYMPHFLNP